MNPGFQVEPAYAQPPVTPVVSIANIQNTFFPSPAPNKTETYNAYLTRLHQQEAEAAAKLAAEQAAAALLAQQQAEAAAAAQATAQRAIIAQAQSSSYANSYDWGQCTWYVASRRSVPSNWGNANQWLGNAQALGWSTGSSPRVGAIAWTGAGYYGHVALVVAVNGNQVEVAEMNVMGVGVVDQQWEPSSTFYYIY